MPSSKTPQIESDRPHILPLSARHPEALAALARSYAEWLSRSDAPTLQDLCYSAAPGRAHHNHRLALVAESGDAMVGELRAFSEHGRTRRGCSGKVPARANCKPVFVFTGMGPQWWGTGIELLDHEPVFRQPAIAFDDLFRS